MMLTKRQKQLLDFVESYIDTHGYAPTIEEIGGEFGLASPATVHKHLTNLERKGAIRRQSNYSRAIELVQAARSTGAVELPMLGYVAAGRPIEAIEGNDVLAVPEEFVRRDNTFVLRVRGDSMIEDGICDGDYIVVEGRTSPQNGETVVALVNGEATVKRFQRDKGGRVRLIPANAAMQPIVVKDKELAIRGVVVAVMRKY